VSAALVAGLKFAALSMFPLPVFADRDAVAVRVPGHHPSPTPLDVTPCRDTIGHMGDTRLVKTESTRHQGGSIDPALDLAQQPQLRQGQCIAGSSRPHVLFERAPATPALSPGDAHRAQLTEPCS
jgi:hypothetical protein